jgi:cytochrome c oxidase subunit III
VSAIIVFLMLIATITGWWLVRNGVASKPWLEQGVLGDPPLGPARLPAAKVGLGVFLAVVGCLFALLVSAYSMRMDIAALNVDDWRAPSLPRLLWLNTGVLVLSSVALQWATVAARRGRMQGARDGLLVGGLASVAFLAGQLLAWRQLAEAGHFASSDPASAFFYLLTGVHGLHIAGGLVALGRTGAKMWRRVAVQKLSLSMELCAAYWHFLLLVWLIIFALLTHGADSILVVCRSLLA